MDIVDLPIARPDWRLDRGLSVMERRNCSALVVKDQRSLWLCTAGDIHTSRLPRIAHLARLPIKRPIFAEAKSLPFGPQGQKLRTPTQLDMQAWDQQLRESGMAIGVAAAVRGRATLVTLSEQFAALLSGAPRDCYCEGPQQHAYGVNRCGERCDFCDTRIVCI